MILLNSSIGNYVLSNGRHYSYFGGNNYLGLANHPAVKEASVKAIEKYGVNFSASRRTSGTADIHLELEKKLSDFKGSQDAVVFASGYMGNSILLEVLKGRYSTVFADKYSHPSIQTAIRSSCSKSFFYKHCDYGHLESLLGENSESSPLIITDGIFALTGEVAPLDRIYSLVKKHNGLLIVDDAHSTGVLGHSGKGTPEHFDLPDDENIIQTETMSKALGSYGGFISGRGDLIDLIREKSAIYQASTSLPPPVVAAGRAAIEIIQQNPELRSRVIEKAAALRKIISNLGFLTTVSDAPIIPIIMPDPSMANHLSSYLEEKGIIVPFMNYPSGNEAYILRIAVSVSHTEEQTDSLTGLLKMWLSGSQTRPALHGL